MSGPHKRAHRLSRAVSARALLRRHLVWRGLRPLFEGTAEQMSASLGRLAALPTDTRVYCAHEYTLSNLRFALAVEPDNLALHARQQACLALRERGEPTLPSTIGEECATNPFLRCDVPAVRRAAESREGRPLARPRQSSRC